ncbi:MAG TPA: amidohydrolase family protein [Candidatus Methylomirabilis sp.]|nr:amidohydrolase family protein [Candidatus Methylomirabilis sp.]
MRREAPPNLASSSRRTFVAGLAVLGMGTHMFGRRAVAQTSAVPRTTPHLIDVHHHIAPPRYITELGPTKHLQPVSRNWTPARSLEDMDRAGVATAIVSITTPGVWFGDSAAARRLARECNDYAARLMVDFPGRFGVFAAVPMPDIEGTLREIAYALDTLKADGIAVFTSYGDKWLGDPAFTPVIEELNRRKAVLYTHPTEPDCCRNLVPDVPAPIIEYGTDTTRTIASLVFSGTSTRFPDVQFIFSHAGGTMPFLAERFTRLPLANKDLAARVPNGVAHELRRFNYDVAQAAHPMALASLLKLVPVSQVLFGTDFPFRTSVDHVRGLADYGFSAADLQAIERGNAVRLLPRLKA